MMAPESSASTDWCAALYDAQAPGLLLYGRSLGLDASEAEDVLHDVFRALLGLEQPPAEPAHYAIRAYRNRALNRHRSLWRRVWREMHAEAWFEASPDTSAAERAAMDALARLPDEQREVLVLKFWHQLTLEEIGRLQGVSPNTAAGRYRYGVAALRRHLGSFPAALEFPAFCHESLQ
jgi:RNA polymerase sigma-70 factor (ECF subfamily)